MVVDSITTLILTDNPLTSVREVQKTFKECPLVLTVVWAQIGQTLKHSAHWFLILYMVDVSAIVCYYLVPNMVTAL